MTIIASCKDLQVHEWASGYEIEHIPTGLRRWMGDGVDMFYNSENLQEAISPGTSEFDTEMKYDLYENYNDLIEAYFPQLLTPRTHYIARVNPVGGYLPSYCNVFWQRKEAAEALFRVCDLPPADKRRGDILKRGFDGFLISKDEYAVIEKCDCLEPWVHSEEGRLEWA